MRIEMPISHVFVTGCNLGIRCSSGNQFGTSKQHGKTQGFEPIDTWKYSLTHHARSSEMASVQGHLSITCSTEDCQCMIA